MKVAYSISGHDMREVGDLARWVEETGFDTAWVLEESRDPFVRLAVAASNTHRLDLLTAVAIAFARTPMTVAGASYELHQLSGGRLVLGLGTQIRPHIERRYSMPWSRPAARMREFVLAVTAIWASWQEGTPLHFEGEFYTHTLMPPAFAPPPLEVPPPPVHMAGVGDRMVAACGEVADGFLAHPLTSPAYLEKRLLPALDAGLSAAGRDRGDLDVTGLLLVATGETEEELAAAVARTRADVSFYASTPAYLPFLEVHGLEELHGPLYRLSKENGWARMPELVDDDVLNVFAVVGEPHEIGPAVRTRYEGIYDSVGLYTHNQPSRSLWAAVLDGFRSP